MTKSETMEKQYAVITDAELMNVEGGAIWAPVVGWVISNPVAAAKIAGGIAAGGIAVYNYATGKW